MSRVVFQATRALAPLSKPGVIPFNIILNEGNGFNPSTNKFCAPKGGIYWFTATFRPEKGFAYGTVKIVKEAKETAPVEVMSGNGTFNCTGNVSCAVKMDAGDQVWAELHGDENAALLGNAGGFTGFLI